MRYNSSRCCLVQNWSLDCGAVLIHSADYFDDAEHHPTGNGLFFRIAADHLHLRMILVSQE